MNRAGEREREREGDGGNGEGAEKAMVRQTDGQTLLTSDGLRKGWMRGSANAC